MSLSEHSIQSTGMQGPRIAAKCWPGLTFNAPVDAQHFAGLLLAATTHKKKKSDYYHKFRVDHHYSGGRFQDTR